MLLATVTYVLVLVTLYLGSVVLYNNRVNKEVRIYFLFSLVSSIWMMANILVIDVSDPYFNHVASVLITPSSALMFYLFYVLAGVYSSIKSPRVVADILFVWLAGILVLSFTPANVTQVIDPEFGVLYEFGFLYRPYILFLLVTMLYGLLKLFLGWRKSRGIKRYQVFLVLTGFFWMFVPALTVGALLPLFEIYSLWNIAHLFAVVPNITVAYAITRYKLFDVRFVAVRAVSYFFVVIVAVLAYFVVSNLFAGFIFASNVRSAGPVQTALLVSVGVLLWPLIRLFNRLTNTLFYRDGYETDVVIDKLQTVLITTNTVPTLEDSLSDIFADSIKPSTYSLVICSGSSKTAQVFGKKIKGDIASEIGQKSEEIVYLHASESAIGQSDLIAFMNRNNLQLYVPLISSKGFEGALFFAEKSNGSIYTDKDMHFLRMAAVNIAQSVLGIRSYQQIADFNKTLKQKVNSATKQLREQNEQLETLHKTKDDFISMASHQLKPKVTASMGFLDLLKRTELRTNKEQSELLELTRKGIERIGDLVVDMLDISRMDGEGSTMRLERAQVNMMDLVREEVVLFQKEHDKRIDLRITPKKARARIAIDAIKIREVIQILLTNADQYSEADTAVTVRVKVSMKAVSIVVDDKGIGMSKAEQRKLFMKFYRSESARRVRPTGTGVGLYAAQQIIAAHDGEMTVKSKRGVGSSIGFRLPLPVH